MHVVNKFSSLRGAFAKCVHNTTFDFLWSKLCDTLKLISKEYRTSMKSNAIPLIPWNLEKNVFFLGNVFLERLSYLYFTDWNRHRFFMLTEKWEDGGRGGQRSRAASSHFCGKSDMFPGPIDKYLMPLLFMKSTRIQICSYRQTLWEFPLTLPL